MAAVGVGLQGQVDGQRHGLGAPGEVAGEGDGGAELAQRPGPAQHRAGDQAGRDQRQGDPAEDRAAGRAPRVAAASSKPRSADAQRALDA